MNNLISVKTNFTAGRLSPNLYGRGDLRIYANGARCLDNVIIHPTGGVSRRFGLRHIDDVEGFGKLISFEFNTEQTYLLCIGHLQTKIFKEDVCIATLETPWEEKHLNKINWTQSADTLLIVHPEVAPQQISRRQGEVWSVGEWEFYSKDGKTFCPYYNFFQKKEIITPSATTGNITLTANNEIFNIDYVGLRIRINEGEVLIDSFVNSKTLKAKVSKNLSNASASSTWEEQAFSKLRGYPNSVTFHQDRMVIGGSKSLPNRLWLSKSSDLFNFDIGKGLDDDAIDFSILSDQVNGVINVVSTRHLLVFTTGAEWMVSGEPLTPTSIKLNRQTNIGSYSKVVLQSQNINGATIFISQSGKQLREFLFADVEQAYQATDLTLLSNDIISSPIDSAYHQDESVLYIILEDGTVSCLTSYRTEEVNAWSKLKTKGKFLSVCVVGDDIYFLVQREDTFKIEKIEKDFFVDCAKIYTSEVAKKEWDNLDYLENQEIEVVGDGYARGGYVVKNGKIKLDDAASSIVVGYPYEHIIEPLPFMVESASPHSPKSFRIITALFRIINSQSLRLNLGSGYFNAPLQSDSGGGSFDVELHSLGWQKDINQAMWSIKSDDPVSFTLLSALVSIKTKE